MPTNPVSRRQFMKGAGALVVSFSFYGEASRLLAQSESLFANDPEATALDSWLAIAPDGSVTVFTSKVDLGTGCRRLSRKSSPKNSTCRSIRFTMESGDTSNTIDQGLPLPAGP